ncbi:ATP-dependent Clp protease proteolytic subunit [Quillaja saponaria]|uniref:ATP-dependent Clp protease proteolytic subunit n=1 Tax=Quillaja saponaria TaxID=32244 RepID=A0AAD7L3J0_QUISA|nr:ATP-dependent Clp protease proteolytic subunit [Quillaja saponaria]
MAAQIRRARYNEYASLSKNYLLGLSGMGIYDAMKLCKADVSTVCLFAAFMGAFLLASGTKGKKFCMPKARLMIHQPLGTAGGKETKMGIRIRKMAYHKIKLYKILSRITGKLRSMG